jgi:poly(A) polymerase
MKNIKYTLRQQDRGMLDEIRAYAKKKKTTLYLVGGYLRDIILKRVKDTPDIDFCLKEGAIKFGRGLSREIKAGFVVLDKEHGCCRLVKKIQDTMYTLDFSDFRSTTLEGDLLHRDFTINTLAVALEKALSADDLSGAWIDLYGAGADLKSKMIRVISKKSFDEDPLRILRAFSLACIFGFKIDKETLKLIQLTQSSLSEVSYERIRDELFKILDRDNASEYLVLLDTFKILKLIIPEIEIMRNIEQGPHHHLDVLNHSLETVRQLEIVIKEFLKHKEINEYLDAGISDNRKRRALIKLGALLHDIGKPETLRHKDGRTIFHGHERAGSFITKSVGRRLKLSNDELDSLRKMVFWHLRPGYMADNEKLSARAKFRYFRDTAKECVSVLLLALADQRATRGPLTSKGSRLRHEKVVAGLIKEYFKKQKEKKLPRLINGDDLLRKFKLQPSPLIGKILSEVEELQAVGRIKTRQQAFEAAKRIVKADSLVRVRKE